MASQPSRVERDSSHFPQSATNPFSWLDWETVLHEIGSDAAPSRRQYVRFVEAALTAPIESPLRDVVGGVLFCGRQR